VAGKRINLADLADEPPMQEARIPALVETPARPPRVDQVAANPLNTRDVYAQPAKITEVADSILRHGQLQPCTVVARTAFLSIFPEHESDIGEAIYVQVTGGRRRAALIEAGRPTMDVIVKNDLAQSRALFISATAAENIDRQDYDPIEEARAVELLVKECGTGKAAAEQLGRTQAWVTQRRNLLKLTMPVQTALRAGDIPLREVRDMHVLPPDDQLAALEAWRTRDTPQLTAVNPPDGEETGEDEGEVPAARTPRPRLSPVAVAIRRLGGTPIKIAETLRTELPVEDLRALAQELLREADQ
jgi:ParB family chromosome partitioning protein